MDKKKQKIVLMLISLSLLFSAVSAASAQTGSLAVWENIADGTLTSTWVENDTAEWKPQNDSGVWEYNCTVTNDTSFTYNDTLATRWFQTFEVTADNDETGIGAAMVHNLTAYYAIVYYYDSTDHNPDASPSAHLMCYDTDHFDYWNGTGFEENESNASDLGELWEKDYTSGFFRVKVMWDFYSTIGCSLHFKLWDPSGDEYPLWMVDLEFPQHPSMTFSSYKPGLFVDSRYDLDASETDFRRIFFWNTTYDLYPPILPIVNEYIACPTINCHDVYTLYDEYADFYPDDIYNQSQLLKDFINLWDLQVIYSEEFFDGALLPYNQNDSIYLFTMMFTDVRDFYEDFFGPGLPEDFPDNILMMRTYLPIDGTENGTDYMVLRIDTDNNDLYDSYDYAIVANGSWSDDGEYTFYQGWTEVADPFFVGDMWSYEAGESDAFSNIFRDKSYSEWVVSLNWDMMYNGSSGERIGDDLCRMSIGWYDRDNDSSVYMQDYDRTDDDSPYPATDAIDRFDDPVFLMMNDSSNWLYFQVDESISGEPMADPEDPDVWVPPSTQTGVYGLLAKIVLELVLVFIALGVIYFVITDYLQKKKTSFKDVVEMFKIILFTLLILGVAALLVALF